MYNLYHCSGVRGKGVDGIPPIVPVPPPYLASMGIKSVGQKDVGKQMVKIGKRWFNLGILWEVTGLRLLAWWIFIVCKVDGVPLHDSPGCGILRSISLQFR